MIRAFSVQRMNVYLQIKTYILLVVWLTHRVKEDKLMELELYAHAIIHMGLLNAY